MPLLTGSTIEGFSSGSALWEFQTQFLSNRSQYVVVDGCWSKLVNMVSGVPQGSVLGQQLFLLYTTELYYILEIKHYSHVDDSTPFW